MNSSPRQSGFSLIELLVALVVLSIAGLALINAVRETTRTAGIVEERALAVLAAENLMNSQWLSGPPQDDYGRYEMAGLSYDWRLEVERTSEPGLVQLTLTLRDPQSDRILAEIISFRRSAR